MVGTPNKSGTEIVIRGFNNNQGELFTQDRLADYIGWFTKFGSAEQQLGIVNHAGKKIRLRGLNAPIAVEIPFGHHFPAESISIHKLFDEYVVRAPDYYCKKVVRSGSLRRFPFIRYDAIFYIEGNRVKQSYNRMLRRPGYGAPAGAYTVQERYGVWLSKD